MSSLFGQATGVIHGKVYEKDTGEPMIAVAVRIEGMDQVQFTDINGAYRLSNVPEGTHVVVASMDGFAPVRVEEVVVTAAEHVEIDMNMVSSGFQSELVVTAQLLENSQVGLLRHRQKSVSISDAISAEEISRGGGGSAADAVKKVTGASVVGGKYVYIRGLGDRYTSTHMNGVELPTADPDVKSFQADLFPSKVLDSIVTVKSFTPDKPGNFSGGIMDIGTKDYPTELTFDVSLSGGFLQGTTGEDDYLLYDGSDSDWRGVDDGLRSVPGSLQGDPSAIPNVFEARFDADAAARLDQVSRSFVPVMSGSTRTAPINQGISLSLGNQFQVGTNRLGVIGSLSYSRKRTYYDDWRLARWKLTGDVDSNNSLINQSDFTAAEGTDKVNWGGLVSANYVIGANHEIGFNTIFTQGGDSRAKTFSGSWAAQFFNPETTLENQVLRYTERNLNSYQFKGEHYFDLAELKLNWSLSTAETSQEEPDTRIFTAHFTPRVINGDQVDVWSIAPSLYQNPARYFRDLEERTDSLNVDLAMPIHYSGMKGKLKFGGLYSEKERIFTELRYEYLPGNPNVRYQGDPNFFFGPENVGIIETNPVTGRPVFGNVIQYAPDALGGNYNGDAEITSLYVMGELPLSQKLKMITGVRHETADFNVTNGEATGILDDSDWLPALHFIYNTSENVNWRFAYGRTLARPTFREKAPYASFDFIADGIFVGNPDLQRTLIDNYDFRWEWFPGSGKLVAASAFYKDFENPIERSFSLEVGGEFGEKSFINVPSATVQGIELEFRHSFDAFIVATGSPHLFSLNANLSLIDSEVDIPAEELAFLRQLDANASDTRELQGQSPYIVNLGLNYDNFSSGTSASLFYNVFGERMVEVGVRGAPDSLEQPRNVLDLIFNQSLWRGKMSLKFNASNLLDDDIKITQTFKGQEFIRELYQTGRSFSLSLSYKH